MTWTGAFTVGPAPALYSGASMFRVLMQQRDAGEQTIPAVRDDVAALVCGLKQGPEAAFGKSAAGF